MKLRVSYTVDVEDGYRRAVAHRYGETGKLATREELRHFFEQHGSSLDDDLRDEHGVCCFGDEPEDEG